jgi:hypothetical protein
MKFLLIIFTALTGLSCAIPVDSPQEKKDIDSREVFSPIDDIGTSVGVGLSGLFGVSCSCLVPLLSIYVTTPCHVMSCHDALTQFAEIRPRMGTRPFRIRLFM